MAVKLIEDVVDFLKDYLETNLSAKLDAIDAEYGDFELADIKSYYVAELVEIPEYPSIVILGNESTPVGEGGGWIRAEHGVLVFCFVTDAETERLRRRLYRYVRAIFELLSAAQSTTEKYIIGVEGFAYSPVYAREGQFLADAHLELKVNSLETF